MRSVYVPCIFNPAFFLIFNVRLGHADDVNIIERQWTVRFTGNEKLLACCGVVADEQFGGKFPVIGL